MDKDELIEIAERGEDCRHQFKVDINSPGSLAAEVVAFRVVVHKPSHAQNPAGVSSGGINEAINSESGGIKFGSGGIRYDTEGQDEALLDIVSKHPGCKVDAIQSITGFAYRSIERSLARLVAEMKIEYRGSKKTGGYYLKEMLNDQVP